MHKFNKRQQIIGGSILMIGSIFVSSIMCADPIQDTKLTTAVKSRLIKERDIPAENIKVSTVNNVVRLSGVVDTRLQMHKAIEIAQSVDGVSNVEENLKAADSDNYLRDALTTAKVKGKIRQLSNQRRIGKDYNLYVETTNGAVHIYGRLAYADDATTIKRAIGAIENVKNVTFNVHV